MNRRGGVHPVVTALILIGSIISAGLVVWYFIYTTSLATKKAVLEVSGGCYVIDNTLYITVKNIGSIAYSGTISVVLTDGSNKYNGSTTVSIDPGHSVALQITLSGSPVADTLSGVLQYGDATLKISVDVIKG
ncbi:MAG: hypothetical protein DRJ32_01845 [Thermoprotei archaeon]|nr:MAG: hypothetical protein DRJ32_01845 [Thermoprotei archaeon]